MMARKLFSDRRLLWVLPVVAMLLQLVGASSAAAAGCARELERGACVFDTETIVSVANLNVFPPDPCDQGVQLTGDFVIQAHIVTPPSPVLPPSPILPPGTTITLHLDATRISGVGLTDGTLYQGSQGTSEQVFEDPSSTLVFNAAFELIPSQPTQLPPRPICPAQLSFQVQLVGAEAGVPAISASLPAPD